MGSDDPALKHVFEPLTRALHHKPRAAILRRYDAMGRELLWMDKEQKPDLLFIRTHGWSDLRLHVAFVLNSFYQEYLGPLDASAHGKALNLGTSIPIVHGSTRFDSVHRANVTATVNDFYAVVKVAKIPKRWLSLNTCGDLVYRIARYIQNSEQRFDDDSDDS